MATNKYIQGETIGHQRILINTDNILAVCPENNHTVVLMASELELHLVEPNFKDLEDYMARHYGIQKLPEQIYPEPP